MSKKFLIVISILLVLILALSMAGCTGKTGERGATGPQGPEGPIGLQGIQGDQGATGPAGVKGDTGDRGATGPAGRKGETGDQGEPGPQGPAGASGAKGATGSKGATGATGPAGKDAAFPTPTIDGVISPGEWNDALWFDEILVNTQGASIVPPVMSIQIYLTNDAENLYIALVLPDTYDMRLNPEVAEGGSDTFSLNIGVVGEERSYSRVLGFNTTDRTEAPRPWELFDDYWTLWSVATSDINTSKYGPDTEDLPIPAGVQSKTIFNATSRVQEISIPLSDLGVAPGTLLRIGGCIRAAEYEGYNFHTRYPAGLDWSIGATHKSFLVR